MPLNRADQLRESKNPLFNERKLRLGTFSSNLSGGCAISTIDGVLEATWPQTMTLAKMSDDMEFEALVPVGRWKGFGGPTNFNGAGFECYTWAAGVGASTKYSSVFATSHVPTVHPVMAAKQGATIDHISGGRFTLNVVTGWYQPEIEMFGEPQMEHDERYERAVEWLAVIKKLWTEEKEFDFAGRFYKVEKGWLQPKPIQKPHPVVMNAGSSSKGLDFATRYCDISFIAPTSHDPDASRAKVKGIKDQARAHGREIKVWTNAYIVERDTEEEAKKFWNHYVHEKGDWVAAENLLTIMGITSMGIPPDILQTLREHFVGGWGGYPLIGSREQIVDGLASLVDMGFDGVILSWAKYIEEMREFQQKTYPLLVQAGLR